MPASATIGSKEIIAKTGIPFAPGKSSYRLPLPGVRNPLPDQPDTGNCRFFCKPVDRLCHFQRFPVGVRDDKEDIDVLRSPPAEVLDPRVHIENYHFVAFDDEMAEQGFYHRVGWAGAAGAHRPGQFPSPSG